MTNCWYCGSPMGWSGDFDFEDYLIESEGMVACLQCTNDECGATAEFYTKMDE